MSFRAAYHSATSGRRYGSRAGAPIRDKTPEEHKREMEAYYRQQANKRNGRPA